MIYNEVMGFRIIQVVAFLYMTNVVKVCFDVNVITFASTSFWSVSTKMSLPMFNVYLIER